MKSILFFAISLACLQVYAQSKPDVFEQNRRLGRGVNIIGYDPIWDSRDQARFQEKHFRLLKEAGFQHVRINLHPFRHMEKTNGWALSGKWLATLDWAVTRATAQGLQVILDLHEFQAMAKNPQANKEQFLAFWKQLSPLYQNAPDSVMFEILNEPNGDLTPELWNRYLGDALAIIRQKNPARAVVVGPGFWNSIDHLQELKLPADDRHLIVTVHYYKPMEFTHQGASWTNQKDRTGIPWGTDAERESVTRDFSKVATWAAENNRPVYLGEFGAYDKAAMDLRVLYTTFVSRAAEKSGWSWAYWQFDGDFIVWDMKRDAWVEPILRALIPQPR